MNTLRRFLFVVIGIISLSVGAAEAPTPTPPFLDAAAREEKIAQAADALRPKLVAQRRDFHIHPELSNREERTARIVAEQLRALGFDDVKTGVAKHGVVGILKGARPGPVVAVRADMDALPIQEVNDVPYKSQTPGVKHACGHDVHTTVQLGVAEVLSRMRDQFPGTIKFIFQPAEEGAPTGEEGGASLMVKEGVLENPRPQAIFGLHVWPAAEVGTLVYQSGPALASSDTFEITIHGKMAHGGAYPYKGIDAIVVASECVTALQTIRSRRIDTLEPMVLSIGTIHGGNRFNVIADLVKMEGTVRTLNEELRARVQELMRQTLDGVTRIYGASFELKFTDGNPVTFNDPALVAETLPELRRVIGAEHLASPRPLMGAEDFSFYQQKIPGFYYFLGVANQARGITALIHTADFDVDEDCLVIGVKAMANVLVDYLQRHAAR